MTEPQVTRSLGIRADLNITKDDLVAIRIAEVEKQLHCDKLALQERRSAAQRELEKLNEARPKLLSEIAFAVVGNTFAALVEALRPFVDADEEIGQVQAHVVNAKNKLVVQAGVSGTSVSRTMALPADQLKRITDMDAQIAAQQAEVKACEEGMLDVKRKLADIPMLERQARSAVARAVMGADSVDGGKVLLDIVRGVSLPGLPAPKV